MKFVIFIFLFTTAFAQTSDTDSSANKVYYKNEAFDGMNKLERIDSLVKEVNLLYGKIDSMKKEMESMKEDIKQLKEAKK